MKQIILSPKTAKARSRSGKNPVIVTIEQEDSTSLFVDLTKAEPQPKPSSRTKLTIDQIQAIRLSYRSFPVSQRQLATLFGLSYNQVYRAVNNWSDTETQKD
ncbi:MAG: hypothetical protein EBT12_07290 [Marivivens sp.]|nr:hypothetical protein [Marivivens sp.]